jgi:hypothetical protein
MGARWRPRVDSFLKIFFGGRTDVGECPVPQSRARLHHRGVSRWELQRVTRPGEPADNEAWPPHSRGLAPRQVWITRLGAYTRVILLADDAPRADGGPAISTQRWA